MGITRWEVFDFYVEIEQSLSASGFAVAGWPYFIMALIFFQQIVRICFQSPNLTFAAILQEWSWGGGKMDKVIAVLGDERDARGGRRVSALRGRKVPSKYRGPSGETWAGRGARPRWLVAAIKGGKKLDDFLIDKSRRKVRKTHRAKR